MEIEITPIWFTLFYEKVYAYEKYVIDTVNPKDFTAGSKARNDIESILTKNGYDKFTIVVGEKKKKILSETYRIKTAKNHT